MVQRSESETQLLARRLLEGLKEAGMRMTPQRIWVCQELARREDHPTAQKLFETLRGGYPSLSLTTVYQTLDALVRRGVITSLGSAGDDAVHYEVNTAPHINLACLTCHRICDLESRHVSLVEEEVQRAVGSRVLSGRIVYYAECLEESGPEGCRWRKEDEHAN